ncbi:MAG: hypothetical protein MUF31_18375 [Akkermansiaceae bacterium]|jgi:hypothetical protein|nr:hypothetical protein [Akkermansiaceae bacterium]
MNPGAERVRKVGRVAWLAMRHCLAFGVTVVSCCVLWTIVYLGLLLWAMIAGGGLGSPLSYPLWLLIIFLTVVFGTLLLILPSTLFASWAAQRAGWGRMSRVPLCLGSMALISLLLGWLSSEHGTLAEAFRSGGLLWVSLLLPLGIYWWVLEGGMVLVSALRRAGAWLWRKA